MSFRGITLEPIHKNIQRRMDQLSNQMAYGRKFSDDPKRTNNSKVEVDLQMPWFSLRSNALVFDMAEKLWIKPLLVILLIGNLDQQELIEILHLHQV